MLSDDIKKTAQWKSDTQFNDGSPTFTNTEVVGTGDTAAIRLESEADDDNDVPFTTPANYDYDNTKIEVGGGDAHLKAVVSGSDNWTFTTPANYTYDAVKVEVTGGAAQLVGSDIIVDMEGYWKCDEASWAGIPNEVIDSSVNTNHGRAVSGANTVAGGKIGRAGFFDGINDSVSIPHHATLEFEKDEAFSLQCWAKIPATLVYQSLMSMQDTPSNYGINLQLTSAGKIRMNLVGSGGSLAIDSINTVDDDIYRHIVITYNGNEAATGLKIYINGSNDTGATIADALAGSMVNTTPFRLGDRESLSQPFSGLLDEVVVWSRELTSVEVTALWNSGSGLELDLHSTEDPDIINNSGYVFAVPLSSFTETSTKPAGSAIKYQISSNDGTTWKWWSGAVWVAITTLNTELADAVATIAGSYQSGNLASLQAIDADNYHVHETGGSPCLSIEIEYTNVNTIPATVTLHGFYDGQPAHNVNVDIYDYQTTSWVTLGQIPDDPTATITQYDFTVTGTKEDYISDAKTVKIRINHTGTGNAADEIQIDYAIVTGEPTDWWYYANEAIADSVVNTNIAALAGSGTFKFRAFLHSTTGAVTPELDNISLTGGLSYPTGSYEIAMDYDIMPSPRVISYLTVTETVTKPANTDIKYQYSTTGGTSYNGSWLTAAELETAIQTIITSGSGGDIIRFKMQLSTSDSAVTPEIDNLNITSDSGYKSTGSYESVIFFARWVHSTPTFEFIEFKEVRYTIATPSGTTATVFIRFNIESALLPVFYPEYTYTQYDNETKLNMNARDVQWKVEFTSVGKTTPSLSLFEIDFFPHPLMSLLLRLIDMAR